MRKKWILVMDSGIGGTWTLEQIKKVLPKENYIYFMDKFNAPYGNKSAKFLKELTFFNISKLCENFDIKLIVFACNTLSSVCYEFIKQKFPELPIIKVEPFFNPEVFEGKNTLIIATNNTIKHNKKLNIYKAYSNIYLKGFGTLAKMIDGVNGNYDILQPYITTQLKKYKDKKIENVVLGCTHFNFIKQQIENALQKEICFFENSFSVAQKLISVLSSLNLKTIKNKQPQTLFVYKV